MTLLCGAVFPSSISYYDKNWSHSVFVNLPRPIKTWIFAHFHWFIAKYIHRVLNDCMINHHEKGFIWWVKNGLWTLVMSVCVPPCLFHVVCDPVLFFYSCFYYCRADLHEYKYHAGDVKILTNVEHYVRYVIVQDPGISQTCSDHPLYPPFHPHFALNTFLS